jgi:hypothetical protein
LDTLKLISLAEVHLDFVAKHGPARRSFEADGVWHCCFPDEFEQWLQAGAPGIHAEVLKAYLLENPIDGEDSDRVSDSAEDS